MKKQLKSIGKVVKSSTGHAVNLFVPHKKTKEESLFSSKYIAAVIPTFKPEKTTYFLAKNLATWHKNIIVVVVDDCTPVSSSQAVLKHIRELSKTNRRVVYLRTPVNRLKAGALNFGIDYISSRARKPDVVVTFDDDVTVTKATIPAMTKALYSSKKMGAVCSLSHVTNKNKNLLTRLQALEYHGFNVVKLADNGFLRGPLVMQGMLSAFRFTAMKQVKGFTVGHLIEDYEITARIKQKGWEVGLAYDADAWTQVPESFRDLWKQRVRWSYGGLHVVTSFWRNTASIFQDLVGHLIFVIMFSLIILSLVVHRTGNVAQPIVGLLIAIALVQFFIAFIFQALTLRSYQNRDKIDWLIRLGFFPEFLYSNLLSILLLGSYIFFVYNALLSKLIKRFPALAPANRAGLKIFSKLGYSNTWGTRV